MLAHVVLITLGLRRAGHAGVLAELVGPGDRLPRHAAGDGRHRSARDGRRSPRSGRPARGCATSPGTCCTSTPTSASGWRCRTSSGPAPTSCLAAGPRVYWWTLYGSRPPARPGVPDRPAARAGRLRHRLVVAAVVRGGPGVVSVLPDRTPPGPAAGAGRAVLPLALPRRPGLDPRPPVLAVGAAPPGRGCGSPSRTSATAAAAGRRCEPGTRVLVEGPYGRAAPPTSGPAAGHAARRRHRRHAAAGAARGAAVRAGDATLSTGASAEPDLASAASWTRSPPRTGAAAAYLLGPRAHRTVLAARVRATSTTSAALRHLVPDIADQDVFLCGPVGWTDGARAAALDPPACRRPQVHLERFTW